MAIAMLVTIAKVAHGLLNLMITILFRLPLEDSV
jgi:hypothetical protein